MRTILKYLIIVIKAKKQMHLLASATDLKLMLCPRTEAASTALCGTSALPSPVLLPKRVLDPTREGHSAGKQLEILGSTAAQRLWRASWAEGSCCLPSTTPGFGWGRIQPSRQLASMDEGKEIGTNVGWPGESEWPEGWGTLWKCRDTG